MKPQLIYIELKSGYSDNGPAWIGITELSKTGQTVYLDNKALKRLKIPNSNANHYDIETGDKYWVSGVKKNSADRHWAGQGKIWIDKNAVDEYLAYTGQKELNLAKIEIVEFKDTDKARFSKIENSILTEEQHSESIRQYWDKNSKKFEV